VCSALTLAILARELPLGEFGRYTFYLALFAFLDGLVDFGSGALVLQKGTSDEGAFMAMLRVARGVRGVVALASMALLALAIGMLDEAQAGWIVLAALYPLSRTLEASSLVFQRRIKHGTPVLLRGVAASLRTLSIAFLVLDGTTSAAPLLAVHAAWIAAANLAQHWAARKELLRLSKVASAWPAVPLRGFLALAFPLALASVSQQAYFYVDNLFVRGMLGTEELGRYNAAARIFSWLVLFAAYATSAALPWLVRQHEAGSLNAATRQLSQPLLVGGVLVCGSAFAFADPLLGFVFGPDFSASAASLRWLLLGALCVFAGAPFLTALVAAGHNWTVAKITTAALLVNVIGNLWWIPSSGIQGAAAATLASEATILVTSLFLLRRRT